jgi:Family of unknown function (DUF6314)
VSEATAGDDTLGFLAGEWNVLRWISDHRTGTDGEFRGRASFRPRPEDDGSPDHGASDHGTSDHGTSDHGTSDHGALEYTELGELSFGSHQGQAFRSLIYSGRADGAADVWFADGRPFFRLDLRAGHCEAEHPCNADQYLVTVTRQGEDCFTERWQVAGPEKDYEMTATYTRCDDVAGQEKDYEMTATDPAGRAT